MSANAEATTTDVAKVGPSALPADVMERGINRSQWHTLFNLFPGAKPASVLMVWDYCKSRQLDPMKKPCHIVPMRVKVGGEYVWKDVVMPGIYEYRITAQRTGLYLGHTEPEYGEELEYLGVRAPKWCAMTFYRWNEKAREKVPFPVKVWFAEVVGTAWDKDAKKDYVNDRWSRAPIQMLTKCTEAAGLREAFPEEFGGEATAEEMEGRTAGVEDEPARPKIQPAQRRQAPAPVAAIDVEPEAEPLVAGEVVSEEETERVAAPAEAPAYIGTIEALIDQPGGGVVVKLNTGFTAATRNGAFITALKKLHAEKTLIELGTKASSDPAKYAPNLEDITPIRDGQEG